jgi:hypothetical protein
VVTDVVGLSRAAKQCRDLGHSWLWHDDFAVVTNTRGAVVEASREVVCQRCHCERVEVLEVPSMRVKKRRYVYPDDYLTAKGVRISRADILLYEIQTSLPLAQRGRAKRRSTA